MLAKSCLTCKDPFYSRADSKKFCSQECYKDYIRLHRSDITIMLSELGKASWCKRKKAYKTHPKISSAHYQVHKAIKNGKLIKQNCEFCGALKHERKIYAHHPDYSKPLEVIWLCQSCHLKLHFDDEQQFWEAI